jgi:pimeloyl-ACP methyl ester carboxylesterase
MSMKAVLRAVAVATVALTLSACSAGVVPEPTLSPEVIPAEYQPFYSQTLEWTDCHEDMQCATATAPLNWDDPTGDTIELALVRHQATSSKKLGSLFVNPGGPGASGVNLVVDSLDYAVSGDVQKHYDVIGFDPRGVGASTPVVCFDDATQLDEYLFGTLDAERGSPEWFAEREAASEEFAQACLERTGDLLAHVDTVSAAHDLDMLRATVGDRQLNYLGYSYGTLLGAIYAENFPGNVGRMVLDGALDPSSTSADVILTQSIGFENALRAYLADCLAGSECPFSGSVDSAMSQVGALLASLEAEPLTASDGRALGADSMLTAIIAPLYDKNAWSFLSDVFAGVNDGDADTAYSSVDWYYSRNEDGSYADNSTESFLAINCLDYPVKNDPAQWAADAKVMQAQAPVIGPYLAYGDQLCSQWPFPAVLTPKKVTAKGAGDVLVVGTTGDPATPYRWAQNLAAQLEGGHLVTYQGEGHTAYNKSNACVNNAVDGFLLRGKVPATDPQC